jgi:hypothetical protein
LVRVILPYDWPTELVDITGEIDPPRAEQTPAIRLLAYGSSNTHGGGAVRSTESYAMLTAARLGFDLINLGFAGSAQMELEMAHFIAQDLDWDIASLDGQVLFTIQDAERPLLDGGVGLVVEEGRMVCEAVVVG